MGENQDEEGDIGKREGNQIKTELDKEILEGLLFKGRVKVDQVDHEEP